MILINLIEIIEISTAFAKYVLNLISTFSFEKCGKLWPSRWIRGRPEADRFWIRVVG